MQLSVLNKRIDGALFDELSRMTSDFWGRCGAPRLHAAWFKCLIAAHAAGIRNKVGWAAFLAAAAPLSAAANPYVRSLADRVPGAERVLVRFLPLPGHPEGVGVGEALVLRRYLARRRGGEPAPRGQGE